MKLLRTLVVLAACGMVFAVPASGSVWLADYLGYDYTWPMPNDLTSPGQWYGALGSTVATNPVYIPTTPAFEYTFYIQSGTLTSVDTVGTYIFYKYENGDGSVSLHGDQIPPGGTPFDYGIDPPNATAPSTFIDGTLLLTGNFTFLQILVDTTTGDGSLSGTVSFFGGDHFPNIPPGQEDGWTFAGLGWGTPGTPDGYLWQIDGEIYLPDPTSTQKTSWGKVKKLFD